jgi:hypothetical protein
VRTHLVSSRPPRVKGKSVKKDLREESAACHTHHADSSTPLLRDDIPLSPHARAGGSLSVLCATASSKLKPLNRRVRRNNAEEAEESLTDPAAIAEYSIFRLHIVILNSARRFAFISRPILTGYELSPMGPIKQSVWGVSSRLLLFFCAVCFTLVVPDLLSALHPKSRGQSENAMVGELPASEADLVQAVEEVCKDQTIHGTYVYEKDKTLRGAYQAPSSSAFGNWQEPGKVFYKVAENVLDPRHFKASNGMGTITVRYAVQAVTPSSTNLRIDAIFVETTRRADQSDGSVESAEYDAVNQHLQAIQEKRAQDQEDQRKLQEEQAQSRALAERHAQDQRNSEMAQSSLNELEQRVDTLRHQLEARAKSDGVPLKSAPFRGATTLQSLPAHSEVLIVIVTPYWYGVETHEGHHGWIRRSELEPLP